MALEPLCEAREQYTTRASDGIEVGNKLPPASLFTPAAILAASPECQTGIWP